jgi:hypothetical protein
MRNLHGWRVAFEFVFGAKTAKFTPSATGQKGSCPASS